MPQFYIGLMSGTSMDGVDGVLAQFPDAGGIKVLGHEHRPFATALREELLALNTSGANELQRAALAANAISRHYAEVVGELLRQHELETPATIGAHGQTVRHQPGAIDGTGFTCQLLNGALLAELTGADVVCDFRSRDLAAGGQGAPLVPAFHQAVFGFDSRVGSVINIGGISNISVLGDAVSGFDCGPGNCLMDGWIQRHRGLAYDAGGAWAAQGTVLPGLLQAMLAQPYFHQAPPKSTGRDLFHAAWLDGLLRANAPGAPAVDVQATLAELSAQSIAACVPNSDRGGVTLICGGGAFNAHLMQRLRRALPQHEVLVTDERGLPAMQVEASAFAWLAMRFMTRQTANEPRVTGAVGPRLLGALYPA